MALTKTVLTSIDRYYFHYPSGATIVTSQNDGKTNAMAVAWHTAMSHHPPYYLVSISPNRYSHSLITESREFVINFMKASKGELVAAVAGCSGRDVDKFAEFGIDWTEGCQVQAPVLVDSIAAYECKVINVTTLGDHDLFVQDHFEGQGKVERQSRSGLHPNILPDDGLVADVGDGHPVDARRQAVHPVATLRVGDGAGGCG